MAWFKSSRSGHSDPDPDVEGPAGPQLSDLNESERDWVDANLAELAAEIPADDIDALGALYEDELHRWESSDEDDRDDPNLLINRIGIGFGEYLRRRSGTSWVLATDQYGTEIAIHGEPGNVLMFPTNMVAKRWIAREYGALPLLAAATLQSIENLRAPGRMR